MRTEAVTLPPAKSSSAVNKTCAVPSAEVTPKAGQDPPTGVKSSLSPDMGAQTPARELKRSSLKVMEE